MDQDGAPSFDQDDVTPAAAVLAQAFPDADATEARPVVQDEARRVLGKIPDWMVQIPAASVEAMRAVKRTPRTP